MIEKYLPQTEFSSQEDFIKNFKINIPENFNFGYDIVDAWAAEEPEKKALLWTNDHGECIQFTFADMKKYTDMTASWFQSLGIGRGDKVMLILKRRYEFWFSIIALHKIGAVAIPATHLLTKKDMINKQLGDLNLQRNFGCTVTRIRRSGIDLSPSPELALKFGDKLMVVGEKEGIQSVARLLGNDAKRLSDTDFFPIAMGIVLGVLFGKLNISFGENISFSPGLTGGILMMALFLSAIGKTGPILWSMSGSANQLLRQLGLLLFLAEVGTSAGKNLVSTFQESGFMLFGVGAAITIIPMLTAALVGKLVFKISLLDLLGTITGGMTSTPGLAAADSMTDSNIPGVAYATVYPIAMVLLILFIQMIAVCF